MNENEPRGCTRRAVLAGAAALAVGARAGRAGDPDYTPIWETPSPVTINPGGTGQIDLTLGTEGEIDQTYTATLTVTIESQQDPQDLPPDLPGTLTVTPDGVSSAPAQQSPCQGRARAKGRGKVRLKRRGSQKGQIVFLLHATIRGAKTKKPLRVIMKP